jgi:hypothetical protein
MTMQVKIIIKIKQNFFPFNNCTISNLLQHCFNNNNKVQIFINNMNIGFQEMMVPNFYP